MVAPSLLIRSTRILLPDDEFLLGDVWVREEKITSAGENIAVTEDYEIVDADRLTLLPGVIEPQVHLREPGLEHKEDLFAASIACARDGWRYFLFGSTEHLPFNYRSSNIKR